MNNYWTFVRKTLFIGVMFELLFSFVLVKIFGNHREEESLLGDVLLLILIFWGIQLLFSIKNLLSWYINYKFTHKELLDGEIQFLIKNKFPKPNETFDLDNPEYYYQDIVDNEEIQFNTRLLSSQKLTQMTNNITFGGVIRSLIMNSIYKKSMKRYFDYCNQNNIE